MTPPARAVLCAICAVLGFAPRPAFGQASPPGPTAVLSLAEGGSPPAATMDAIRWLQGAWEGELEGAMQQHFVFAPTPGQMPTFARAWGSDGAVSFYEIGVFAEVEGSLEYRVKHFSSELAGWEDRDAYVRRPLVAITAEAAYFDGITFVKDGHDRHTVYFRIPAGDRQGEILVIHQNRVRWSEPSALRPQTLGPTPAGDQGNVRPRPGRGLH